MEIDSGQREWRAVPGFEGFYEVSNHGDVRSMDRSVDQENRGGMCRLRRRGVVLSPHMKRGYLFVGLWKDGKRINRGIHQLVALAFIGPCPPGMEVCHGDGDRFRNVPSNLRYGTPLDNAQDTVKHARSRPGSQSHLAKLTEDRVREIRAAATSMTRRELSERFGVPYANLGYIVHRKTWTHI